jgi:hypothetical protein
MKKLIWILLLLPILLTGTKEKEQWHYELPFRAFDLNDSIPTINQFGQIRNGIIVDAIVNACNADPSGVKLTPVELDYIRSLVGGMYVIGTWQKSNAIYGFVGGNAFKHKFNWKAPTGSFNLSFFGNITHNSLGMKADGTTGYANTNLNPSTSLTLNSTHLSAYINQSGGAGNIEISAIAVQNQGLSLLTSFNGTAFSDIYNSSDGRISSSVSSELGYTIGNRFSSSSHKLFRNGILLASNSTSSSTGLPNANLELARFNNPSLIRFSSKRFAMVTIGAGLTDKEAIQQSQIVTYSQTILGRQ